MFSQLTGERSLSKSLVCSIPKSKWELGISDIFVTEMGDKASKITVLNELVHSLPIENFELLRALSGYLLRIVENSDVNKMTIRNGMFQLIQV